MESSKQLFKLSHFPFPSGGELTGVDVILPACVGAARIVEKETGPQFTRQRIGQDLTR
jgi:hypothetical protein